MAGGQLWLIFEGKMIIHNTPFSNFKAVYRKKINNLVETIDNSIKKK